MAWEYPKHSCGHEGERVQMYGPGRDRARKLAWMEKQPCTACRAKQARDSAQESGLPILIGSEKQIAWASEIRARILALYSGEERAEMEQQANASWWIDHHYSK